MLAIVTQDQWDELWNALPPQMRQLEMTSNGVQCQVVPTQRNGGVCL